MPLPCKKGLHNHLRLPVRVFSVGIYRTRGQCKILVLAGHCPSFHPSPLHAFNTFPHLSIRAHIHFIPTHPTIPIIVHQQNPHPSASSQSPFSCLLFHRSLPPPPSPASICSPPPPPPPFPPSPSIQSYPIHQFLNPTQCPSLSLPDELCKVCSLSKSRS